MAAEHGGERFAAALEGDVAQLLRIDTGSAGDQRGLHPVLAADGGAGAEYHAARVFLHCGNQLVEVLVGRVGTYRDGAVISADRGEPAHGVLVVATELALGEVEQRAAGEGGDGAGFRRTLGDHRVVGHRADAAGHVGDAHRCFEQAAVLQAALGQLAGQVETAAGLGRGDALGALGFGQQLAREQQAGRQQGETAESGFHRVVLAFLFCLPDRQAVADDQTVLVGVAGEIGAKHRIAHADRDVLQRTALHHVFQLNVAFPLAAVVAA